MNLKLNSFPDAELSSGKLLKILLVLSMSAAFSAAQAASVSYTGTLGQIIEDSGTATYSGVSVGAGFAGEIDDTSLDGFITDGTTATSFPCCIGEAVGVQILNDEAIDATRAEAFNAVLGTTFAEGDLVDVIRMQGAANLENGGLMKITLSMLFDSSEFVNYDIQNYPPNLENSVGNLFVVEETDVDGNQVYVGIGSADQVTIGSE